jgi:hypothetical protein
MGQSLLNPPTVEGWHTGQEWIDGGTLNERVNFAVNEFADVSKPGVQAMVERLSALGPTLTPEVLVDHCLELVGALTVSPETRQALLRYARNGGALCFGTPEERQASAVRVGRVLQLIVASKEYQFA